MNPDYKKEVFEKDEHDQELLTLIESGYSTRKAKRFLERQNKRRKGRK